MTLDDAGRRQGGWRAKNGEKICKHERMVDYLKSKKGKKTGYLVCMECEEAFIDPLKQIDRRYFKTLEQLQAEEA
jgi:hypothetical protein